MHVLTCAMIVIHAHTQVSMEAAAAAAEAEGDDSDLAGLPQVTTHSRSCVVSSYEFIAVGWYRPATGVPPSLQHIHLA